MHEFKSDQRERGLNQVDYLLSLKKMPTAVEELGFDFSFAFQPIVDIRTCEVISYEALVRGPHGEHSGTVLEQLNYENVGRFEGAAWRKAIQIAQNLKIRNNLSLNLFPKGLYRVDLNLSATFQASQEHGFPVNRIIFEVTESESLTDRNNLLKFLRLYQEFGFTTAIDDFGTGYSGLKLLVEYQPNYIKLDRHLIADIHKSYVRQSIVSGMRNICERMNIEIMAEGVEKQEEYRWLRSIGIHIFQGYYFARPAFETLPQVAPELYNV